MTPARIILLYIILLSSHNQLTFSFCLMSKMARDKKVLASTSNTATSAFDMVWAPLQDLMNTSDPSKLCNARPRLAKDNQYASAVLEAWRKDASTIHASEGCMSMGTASLYHSNHDQSKPLNGYLVVPSYLLTVDQEVDRQRELPAIILFHTGAGPQDIFLRWKADMLIRELKDCIILIADMICDDDGYAWSDRDKYEESRKFLLASFKDENEKVARWNLRRCVVAAIQHLKALHFVKVSDIAAMGYCMGGHPILELGMMQDDRVKALISYHGVFDGVKDYDIPQEGDSVVPTITPSLSYKSMKVLICNGKNDPFVDQDDVQKAKLLLEMEGCDVKILNFEYVRHGFTNPAQDFNPLEAFAYNEVAAKISWDSSIQLLNETFR